MGLKTEKKGVARETSPSQAIADNILHNSRPITSVPKLNVQLSFLSYHVLEATNLLQTLPPYQTKSSSRFFTERRKPTGLLPPVIQTIEKGHILTP
jgi:hypothetical protein